MIKILQRNEPLLRTTAVPIPLDEIQSKKIQTVILNMKKALAGEPDGIAIAAPQIGEPYRIFIISKRIYALRDDGTDKEGFEPGDIEKYQDEVYINPEIIKISKEKKLLEEGCLSVRYLYGKVRRSVKASIKAYDQDSKAFTRGGSGLRAQIFQHETDHLEGKLFSDKATGLREIPPEYPNKDH